MGRLMASLYDRLTRASEEACLQQWRAELVGGLAGQVLETALRRVWSDADVPPPVVR